MKEVLSNILDGYLFEKSQTFSGNELADLIRRAAPLTIQNKAAISEARYKVQGGPGQGQWAEIPWITVFDKQITTSAQEGYYIVYLFRSDMSGVYLSLNMGWTQFENHFKPLDNARKKIRQTANICKQVLRSSLTDFSYDPIELKTKRVLGIGYELGHICGKFYPKGNIPDDSILIDDLRNLIGAT